MQDNSFYEILPSFDHFYQVTDSSVFHEVPESWWIVIADVQGSTVAIREGRYRDVNLVGSACITAVLNAYSRKAIPFVFGGDGATLLLPDEAVISCKEALLATKDFAKNNFNLELRIGLVPVKSVKAHGLTIEVAKYQVAAGNFLAMFHGGGLPLAEKWVKTQGPQGENFRLNANESSGKASLDGLSCRWEPLKSAHGKMLSILVTALGSTSQQQVIYRNFMVRLEEILGQMAAQMNPVKPLLMKTESAWKATMKEVRIVQPASWAFLFVFVLKFLEISFIRWFFVNNKSLRSFRPDQYKTEVSANSDFRKFDDMLRMVIDCTEDQIVEIRQYLEVQRLAGQVYYGLHISSEAVMTCLVFAPSQNQHIHFIDGSHGGYSTAAVELKNQMTVGAKKA
jgi:hypothetical protein